jgi:hypothetical protein
MKEYCLVDDGVTYPISPSGKGSVENGYGGGGGGGGGGGVGGGIVLARVVGGGGFYVWEN